MFARVIALLQAAQAANSSSLQDRLVDTLLSSATGALIAIAAFRSRLDRHTDALRTVKEQRQEDRSADANQRREDREEDRRAREAIAKTFSDMCSQLDRSRQQEMQFIQRQVQSFDQALKDSERRQRHILDLMAAIARKLDISHRLTDAMVAMGDDDTPTPR